MNNINYKLKGGESQKEVRSRMLDVLNQILEKHNVQFVVFGHCGFHALFHCLECSS